MHRYITDQYRSPNFLLLNLDSNAIFSCKICMGVNVSIVFSIYISQVLIMLKSSFWSWNTQRFSFEHLSCTEETRCEHQRPKAEVSGRVNEAAGRDEVDTLSFFWGGGGGRRTRLQTKSWRSWHAEREGVPPCKFYRHFFYNLSFSNKCIFHNVAFM